MFATLWHFFSRSFFPRCSVDLRPTIGKYRPIFRLHTFQLDLIHLKSFPILFFFFFPFSATFCSFFSRFYQFWYVKFIVLILYLHFVKAIHNVWPELARVRTCVTHLYSREYVYGCGHGWIFRDLIKYWARDFDIFVVGYVDSREEVRYYFQFSKYLSLR